MTPKDKAEELRQLFYNSQSSYSIPELANDCAKRCALIHVGLVDEMIHKNTPKDDPYANLMQLEYWGEVKQHIEQM